MSRKKENADKAGASPESPPDFSPFEVTLMKALILAKQDKLDGLTSTEMKAFSRGRLTPNVLNTVARMAGLPPDEFVFRVYRAAGRIPLSGGEAVVAHAYARELAYRLWVQFSTRVVAFEIDWEQDDLAKVYDSWYSCFQQARTLVEEIPVWRDPDHGLAREVLGIATTALNQHMRSHLTAWQSRFRHWSDETVKKNTKLRSLSPQVRQKQFPKFDELRDHFEQAQSALKTATYQLHKLVFPQASQR